jgi:uroporphyrinogen decarboxylase
MDARTKLLRAVRRSGPVPFPKHLRLCPALQAHFRAATGAEDLDAHFGLDMKWVSCGRPEEFDWGGELSAHEFSAQFDFDVVARRADGLHATDMAVVSGYEPGTFEEAHGQLGMESFFVRLMENPRGTAAWLARIARNKARVASAYARAGVDIVFIGDDMGSQRALLMSEQMWHEYLRSPLETIIAEVRSASAEVPIAYHSCGHIGPLIPALIETGIDVLESVQPECNDVPRLVRDFGGSLSFWGCIGAQSTMARGTPAEVRKAVLDLAAAFPGRSGLIIAPAHTLEPDTPPENVTAFLEAVAEADEVA